MKKKKTVDKKRMVAIVSLILAALLLITLLAGLIPSHGHSHTALPITASFSVDAV